MSHICIWHDYVLIYKASKHTLMHVYLENCSLKCSYSFPRRWKLLHVICIPFHSLISYCITLIPNDNIWLDNIWIVTYSLISSEALEHWLKTGCHTYCNRKFCAYTLYNTIYKFRLLLSCLFLNSKISPQSLINDCYPQ